MKAGVIGVVDGDFDVVDSFATTVEEDERELARCLEIDRVFSLPSGTMAFEGRAAAEVVRAGGTPEIADGEIRVREAPRTETRYTEFVGVPGEFVVVGSGDGTFAFDLIGADTNTDVDRAAFDLDAFFERRAGARPWQAGFASNGEGGVNGVFHGSDLRESRDLDRILSDSSLNQLGLTYEYDGHDVKMTAARSGYVELYRPGEFGSDEYLEYLRDQVVPHLT